MQISGLNSRPDDSEYFGGRPGIMHFVKFHGLQPITNLDSRSSKIY